MGILIKEEEAVEITRTAIDFGTLEIFGMTLHPTIHWYGVIIVLGIVLAATMIARLTEKDHDDPEIVWNGLMWVVLAGVLGARLWSVFFPAGDAGQGRELSLDYLLDLNNGPLAIWSGGLSIFGAVLGGAIGLVIYARGNNLAIFKWSDRAVLGLPLAQAMGRWGNYLNQELYGEPSDLPWAITIDFPIAPYEANTTFHPLFLYESLWNIALFAGLYYLYTRKRQKFQQLDFFLMYLCGYSVIRFLLEFIRVEVPLVNGVNVSQVTTAIVGLIAMWILILRHWFGYFTAEQYIPFGKKPRQKKVKKAQAEEHASV